MFDRIKAYYQSLVPDLPDQVWLTLEERLSIRLVKKGNFLVREGETCRHVSFINFGLVRIYYISEGREICTGFVRANEYVSEYNSFLTQSPSALYIEAMEDTEVVDLSYQDMQMGYEAFPFFERFGRKMAEKLFIILSSQNNRLLTLTPEQRYEFVMEQQSWILQKIPQYMIASYIGITPEHLSRIRKKRAERSF
ncbi:MAG TPA: Crp/Fnr family transcriptional regulator [Chitinophagaceae bacterium]|nr:Crp/Fnr family transcriptional regulator [Chitinophagaceae bacterium]